MSSVTWNIQARPRRPHRAISGALGLSVAAHWIIFAVIVAWWVSDAEVRVASPSTLSLTLVQPNATLDRGVAELVEPQLQVPTELAVEEPKPAPQPAVEFEGPTESSRADPIDEMKQVVVEVSMQTPKGAESPSEKAQISFEPVSMEISEADPVALTSRPLASAQRQMIDERISRWSRAVDAIAEGETLDAWKQGDRTYSAVVTHLPAANDTDLDRAIVEVSTKIDGAEYSTQLQLKRLAFSHFAQLIDRWDPEVSFSDDVVHGRFHSNSKIVVAPGRPAGTRFEGKVTVASTVRIEGRGRRSEVFAGGLETRVPRIPLNREGLGERLVDEAEKAVHVFQEDAEIVFLSGGGFAWASRQAPDRLRQEAGFETGGTLVGAKGVALFVRGQVRGAMVVYSPERITITGDLTYVHDPRQVEDSSDYLGLISERNVEIASPGDMPPGNLTVHAAIYARGRFAVRGHRVRNRGLLTIVGSLTAGSLTATEPRYATRLKFDPRLERSRPPGFPMTGRYDLESWDSTWTRSSTPGGS